MFTVSPDRELDDDLILEAIEYNDLEQGRYDTLESYYLGKHQILSRTRAETKANNKIMVNHAKYITDINTGYLIGQPVEYQPTNEGEDLSVITEMYDKQMMGDLDHEIAKNVSTYGRSYEYIFADENKDLISKRIDVRNCVVVYDDTFKHDKMYAIVYERDDKDSYTHLMTLDDKMRTTWSGDKSSIKALEETPHNFDEVPVIEYMNNSDALGDFEQVVSLIDAYNILASDRVNDKEDLVNSILMIKGMKLPKQSAATMRVSRILSNVPADGDAKYITKELNEGELTILRGDIIEDIHKISMTPNLSDENFVGNSSGVAIKYKLIAFEQNVKTKERYLEKGLVTRMVIYSQFLSKAEEAHIVNSGDVDVVFKRNLPQNDLETSQYISNLTGLVDDETLVAQLSFVKDAEDTLKKVKLQNMGKYTTGEFGTVDETLERLDADTTKEVEDEQQSILDKLSNLMK